MYRITKKFHFSAAHRLKGLPDDHPCSRQHGHNYIVEMVLESDVLDSTGFVRDYGDLGDFKKWVDDTLDHRDLNEVTPLEQTSAENLARFIYERWHPYLRELAEVRVSETPKTWAIYRPETP